MPNYPECKKIETRETFFDTELKDDYRWLEDANSNDTLSWVAQENAFTDAWFSGSELQAKVEALRSNAPGPVISCISKSENGYLTLEVLGGEKYLFFYDRDMKNPETVLENYGIQNYVPWSSNLCPWDDNIISLEGPYDGAPRPTSIIMRRDTKEIIAELGNGFYNTWSIGKKRFYYSYTSSDAEAQICRSEIFYYDFEKCKEVSIFSDDGTTIFANAYGLSDNKVLLQMCEDYSLARYYLYDEETDAVTPIADEPKDLTPIGLSDGSIYFISREHSELGEVISIPPGGKVEDAEVKRAEAQNQTLERGFIIDESIYILLMDNIRSRVIRLGENGKPEEEIPLPGEVGNLLPIGESFESSFFWYESFTDAPRALEFDGTGMKTLMRQTGSRDYDGLVVEQRHAPSASDGTPIPYYFIYKGGTRPTGDIPVMMYAYGGYNTSSMPDYRNPVTSIPIGEWVEKGGIYVHVNNRGGNEFGTSWHEGGMLLTKKNCYFDFIGVTEKIVEEGWTRPERIAITGLSNGGLMVSALLTMRPDLFGCVIDSVPQTDMIHVADDPRGNMYITEYGNPRESREMFDYLLSYSPYHNIEEREYPPIYIQTGECDNNVPPYHSKKFAAKLQAMNRSDNPVLLRVLERGSHDRGSGDEFFRVAAEMKVFMEKALHL